MRKTLAVIRREVIERVRTKTFWIFAVLGPVFFGLLVFVPILLAMGGGGTRHIVVVDGTASDFGTQVAAALDGRERFVVTRVAARPGVEDSLTQEVGAKRLEGFLLLSDAVLETGAAEYRASNVSSFQTIAELEQTLRQLTLARRLEQQGVNPEVVAQARVSIALATRKIARGRLTEQTTGQSFTLAYFMGILLYMAIALFGAGVLGSVLEEKTTRVVEVLVSSLRPFQLMMGKVLGVALVSILQFAIWGVSAKLLLALRGAWTAANPDLAAAQTGDDMPFQLPAVSLETAGIFLAFFLGGFLLYSAMFAAVGAMSNNETEARQAQQPVMVMLILAFLAMFTMLNDPDSTLAIVLSLVPFTSPIAFPVRWAAGNVAPLDVAGSLVLLGAGVVGVTWVAARIYRVGILMTGKRPTPRELWRWVTS